MVDLEVPVNKIAKNLLLGNTCQTCNHYKVQVQGLYDPDEGYEFCTSLLRSKRNFNIGDIAAFSWSNFKKSGNKLPDEKTCEYWE